MYELFKFTFRGQEVTIDLSPYGATGSHIGITERCERAQQLLNHLTVLRAETQADHQRVKGAVSRSFASHCQMTGEKHTSAKEEVYMESDASYTESRRVRDFCDYAYTTMQMAIPRLRRLEEHALEGERWSRSVRQA